MTSASRHIVIIGAGLAGTGAAETLRTEGFGGEITLISSEPDAPYDHVPLSKNYLRNEPGYHRLTLHDDAFYTEQHIDLRLSTIVRSIDPARHRVHLDRDTLHYDKLLIATGSHNRRLRVPGSDLDGVCSLRTRAEADRLKAALAQPERLVVIGAGFVGCEIAASARQLGTEVALVGRDRLPMPALGPVASGFYREAHRAHGVHLHLGTTVAELRGDHGRVRQVVLADGTTLAADLVVVGVGAEPAVELAADAGLPVDNGILTDQTLAAGAPDVYAAGDVANVARPDLGRRLRTEHFATALAHGPLAARNLLGENLPDRGVPFFFSDQYDIWMEHTGYRVAGAEPVLRGVVEDGQFVIFWVRDGTLVAALNIGVRGVPDLVTPAIATRRRVDSASLADPDTDLADLLG